MMKLPSSFYLIDTSLDEDKIATCIQTTISGDRGQKSYRGQMLGSSFWICRSPLGLPQWLFPTIVGKIYRNHHRGHQIELSAQLQNWVWVLLVVWIGGLTAFCITVFGNQIIARIPEDDAISEIAKSAALLAAILTYFYWLAWRDMRYVQKRFIHRLPGSSLLYLGKTSTGSKLRKFLFGRSHASTRGHRRHQQVPSMSKLPKHVDE
jgi:hypothetical protein